MGILLGRLNLRGTRVPAGANAQHFFGRFMERSPVLAAPVKLGMFYFYRGSQISRALVTQLSTYSFRASSRSLSASAVFPSPVKSCA
jgi:hypothetical protein